MDSLPEFLEGFLSWALAGWKIVLVKGSTYTIFLGPFLLGILTFMTGWKVLRLIILRKSKSFLKRLIRDDSTRVWFENFLTLIMLIILFQVSLVITGIPVKALGEIWGFKLFTVKEHAVTLGNIFLGIMLLYPGIMLSRYISAEFQTMFLGKLNIDLASKKSLEAVFRYFLLIIVVLFVLTIIGIPLSAFTLLGGAIAIGIGLGSQNLVNNFLSGLVLMAERPLKMGDIVELEGRRGTVEHVGGRATRIRTFDNIRMVMPNSKLLENTVINWSLVDSKIRRELKVGIAYGSDTRKARDIIFDVINGHPDIKKEPEPLVLFMDFGDSALMFSCYYWVEFVETLNAFIIESELRFQIDEQFQKAGIVIAFPQRDLHLDTLKPLDINIIKNNKNKKQGDM